MSFIINGSYTEELHFEQITPREIYALLLKAIAAVGWSQGEISEDHITAFPGFSLVPFGEVVHIEINHSKVRVNSRCIMPQLWSFGKNKHNVRKLCRAVEQLIDETTTEQLNQQYMAASSSFIAARHETAANLQFKDITNSTSKLSGFLSIFNPKPGYFITPILMDLNIFFFLLIGLAGAGFWQADLRGFHYLGSNSLDSTLAQHEWWRLLSYQFMHGSFLHLFGNMFGLLMLGAYLEPLLGRARFLIFYLLCGVMGGVLSIYMHPFNVSVGASGSIMGLSGVFLALVTSNLFEKHTRNAILSALVFYILLQLIFDQLSPQVDKGAHIGGLVTGCILGFISVGGIRTHKSWGTARRLTLIVVGAMGIVCLALWKMPNKQSEFRDLLTEFNMNDIRSQRYLGMIDNTSDDNIVREIRYQTLGFIKQNAAVLDRLDKLPIGTSGHYRVQLMRKYLLLQVQRASHEMFWIYFGRKTQEDLQQVRNCDVELRHVTYELSNIGWEFD